MIDKYFHDLRNNDKFHLGLGDIRLTIGMQQKLVDRFAWRDVSDTFGLEDGKEYLVCGMYKKEHPFATILIWDELNEEFYSPWKFTATHWMPLPELPEINTKK